MKIAIVHRYYNLPGAITPIVKNLLKEYKNQKQEVKLIFEENKNERLVRPFLNSIKFYRKCLLEIKKFNPDIVLTHSYPVVFLRYFIQSPIILIVHNHGFKELKTPFTLRGHFSAIFRKFALRNAEKLFAVSSMIKEDLIEDYKIPKDKIVVNYNPLNFNKFKKVNVKKEKNKFIILHRGTDWRKGFDLVIKWAPMLIKKNKNIHFLILGPKKEIPKSLEEHFKFKEWVEYERMPEVYSSVDLVISPSKYDPFPGVVLEAMSCEKVVLMSNRCGTKELIKNGKNGFVSSLDDFPKKILELSFYSKEKLDKIGKSARNTILSKLSCENVVKKQIIEFKKILRK